MDGKAVGGPPSGGTGAQASKNEELFGLRSVSLNSFGSDPPYVLKLATNRIGGDGSAARALIASSSSDKTIKVHAFNTSDGSLSYLSELKGHSARINAVGFVPGQASVIFSGSEDGRLALWDVRSGKCARSMSGNRTKSGALPEIFSAACSDRVAAAGFEDDVVVWDLGSGKRVVELNDFHSDEVTYIRFHPSDSTALYSADCSGMINQFDLKQSDPDEVLETAINTETPIRRFGFFGPKSQYIYAITADETASLFDIEEASPIAEYPRAREALTASAGISVSYLVDCHWSAAAGRLYIVAGSGKGEVVVSHQTLKALTPVLGLRHHSGHSDIVRDVLWFDDLQSIVTGGEDSKICVWAKGSAGGAAGAVGATTAPQRKALSSRAVGRRGGKSTASPYGGGPRSRRQVKN